MNTFHDNFRKRRFIFKAPKFCRVNSLYPILKIGRYFKGIIFEKFFKFFIINFLRGLRRSNWKTIYEWIHIEKLKWYLNWGIIFLFKPLENLSLPILPSYWFYIKIKSHLNLNLLANFFPHLRSISYYKKLYKTIV